MSEKLSTHAAFVIPVKLEPHPNADTLSIVSYEGFILCVRTEEWIGQDKGIHIQPETIVDTTRAEFAFLTNEKNNKVVVKPIKLRGIISYGFIIPAPSEAKIGDDYASILGIEHYKPPQSIASHTDNICPPKGFYPKYDIDSIRKYNDVIKVGERCFISEKIHGCNARYLFSLEDKTFYVGSRTKWKKEDDRCVWWQAIRKYPQIQKWCESNPGEVVCGEVYGQVQDLKYGKTDVDLAIFDIMKKDGTYYDAEEWYRVCKQFDFPHVPIIAWNLPFKFEEVIEYSNGESLISGVKHCREGCVIKPMIERYNKNIGRVILKAVGTDYLLGKKQKKKQKKEWTSKLNFFYIETKQELVSALLQKFCIHAGYTGKRND